MSSFSEKNLSAFIYLLSNHSHLFSDTDREELLQHLKSIEDDKEKISEAILHWCSNKPEIKNALQQTRLLLFPSNPDVTKAPGQYKAFAPKPDPNLNKEALENTIKRSSNTSNDSSSCNKNKKQDD